MERPNAKNTGTEIGTRFSDCEVSAAHNFKKFIKFFNIEVYFSTFVKVIVSVAVSMSSIGLFAPFFFCVILR